MRNNGYYAFRCLCRTSLMRAPVNLCVYFLMTLATMSYQFYSIAKPNPIVDDQLNHCHQVARQYDIFGSQSISKCRWNFYSSTDWPETCQTLLWWPTTVVQQYFNRIQLKSLGQRLFDKYSFMWLNMVLEGPVNSKLGDSSQNWWVITIED